MELTNKDELETSYLKTIYSVFIGVEQYDVKIFEPVDSVLKNFIDKETVKSAVVLTAWNPQSHQFPLQENKDRNNALSAILKKNNYTIFSALGQSEDLKWQAEESFFIVGITKEAADKLAADFGQYAYVWIESETPASLIFTSIWQSFRTE